MYATHTPLNLAPRLNSKYCVEILKITFVMGINDKTRPYDNFFALGFISGEEQPLQYVTYISYLSIYKNPTSQSEVGQ
jgi:hypothetical protein